MNLICSNYSKQRVSDFLYRPFNILYLNFKLLLLGFGKSPGYTTVSWGGDQNVDFSYADGLASVVPAALSLGMSGKLIK